MAVINKATNHHSRRQVTNSHRRRAWVNAKVKRDWLIINGRNVFKGGLVEKPAPLQFFRKSHYLSFYVVILQENPNPYRDIGDELDLKYALCYQYTVSEDWLHAKCVILFAASVFLAIIICSKLRKLGVLKRMNPSRKKPTPRRRPAGKQTFTTKSGNTIKLNQGFSDRIRANRAAKARRRAAYLSSLPQNRWKRLAYRLHPKRVLKYWFSREGAVMALKLAGIGIVVCFILLVGVFAYFRKDLPNIKDISGDNLGGSITYYDRTGQTVLWQDYDAVKRVPVKTDQISPYMKNATIAIEDKEFYNEGAFSIRGISRAVFNNITGSSGPAEGGSTITQQLVKLNQDWTKDRTITRKIKELILAVNLEREYSKDDILTGYLNIAPYGGIEYGVESAARDYFGTTAKDLTLAQASMLAAIPQAPSYYSPYSSPTYNSSASSEDAFGKQELLDRQHYILDQMVKQGYITKQQATDAKTVDVLAQVKPLQQKYSGIKAPYFVLAAKSQLEKKYGAETVNRGGWKVTTSLDMNLQSKAEQLVASNLPNVKKYGGDQEAMVAEQVQTGQIVMLVGGVDFSNPDYGQINYAQTKIPPGSSFKPYDYVSLINDTTNAGAGAVLYDSQAALPGYPCTNKAKPADGGNCLTDYDFKYPDAITIRYALAGSRNVPAVKSMLTVGTDKVIKTADAMMDADGAYNCYSDEALTKTTQCYGSSAIGDGAYLHLDQHVNGLSTLGRLGKALPTTYILKITDAANKTVYNWTQPAGKQVVKAESAYIIDDILSDTNATYLRSNYKFQNYKGWKFAVKTGTTNDNFDGLMTSWSTQYAVVSWVGYHTRNIELTGGHMEQMTTPLTRGFMEAAHDMLNTKPVNWTKPSGVQTLSAFVFRGWNVSSGAILPSPSTDLFPSWYVRKSGSTSQTLDKVSGKLATSCTPDAAKQTAGGANANIYSADIFVGTKSSSVTATDDVHNCSDAKPSVTLTAPSSCTVGSSCNVTVTVTQGTHDLSSSAYPGTVNLYVNGTLVQTQNANSSPSTLSFNYTPTSAGSATFKAEVIDSVLYSSSSDASVTFTGSATTTGTGNN
jgi:penicillin-binding protein 1A